MRTLKAYVRALLDEGLSVEQAWKKAEAERWHAPWGYVCQIARGWKREKEDSNGNRAA